MDPIIGAPQAQGLTQSGQTGSPAGSPTGSPSGALPAGETIKDSDTQSFGQDVVQASMQVPVLVDFWATWCGPCKQLGPALEKLVAERRGAVKLVKIDVDKNQALAQQLRIASIPTVYAFYQGQPVDGFQGALPESQLKQFLEQLIDKTGGPAGQGPSIEQALEQAKALQQSGAHEEAAALYAEVLQFDERNATAIAGLLRCQLDLGDVERAAAMYEGLEDDLKTKPEVQSFRAALELAQKAADTGEIAELLERVAHDPKDHQARYDLAQALYAANKREAAVEELLEIVRRQRSWNEDAARKLLLTYFEAWGASDPLTLEARRRLSSLLFA